MFAAVRHSAGPSGAAIRASMGFTDATEEYQFTFYWDHTDVAARQAFSWKQLSGGTYFNAKLTTTLLADTWYRVGGTFDGTNVKAYLNGALETTTAGGAASVGVNPAFSVLSNVVGASHFWAGTIGEAALWSVALDAAEFAALGKGWSPLFIRPASLIYYLPLVRDIADFKGAALTTVGTTIADHVGVIQPSRSRTVPGLTTFVTTKSGTRADAVTGTEFEATVAQQAQALLATATQNFKGESVHGSDAVSMRDKYRAFTPYLATGRHKSSPRGD